MIVLTWVDESALGSDYQVEVLKILKKKLENKVEFAFGSSILFEEGSMSFEIFLFEETKPWKVNSSENSLKDIFHNIYS